MSCDTNFKTFCKQIAAAGDGIASALGGPDAAAGVLGRLYETSRQQAQRTMSQSQRWPKRIHSPAEALAHVQLLIAQRRSADAAALQDALSLFQRMQAAQLPPPTHDYLVPVDPTSWHGYAQVERALAAAARGEPLPQMAAQLVSAYRSRRPQGRSAADPGQAGDRCHMCGQFTGNDHACLLVQALDTATPNDLAVLALGRGYDDLQPTPAGAAAALRQLAAQPSVGRWHDLVHDLPVRIGTTLLRDLAAGAAGVTLDRLTPKRADGMAVLLLAASAIAANDQTPIALRTAARQVVEAGCSPVPDRLHMMLPEMCHFARLIRGETNNRAPLTSWWSAAEMLSAASQQSQPGDMLARLAAACQTIRESNAWGSQEPSLDALHDAWVSAGEPTHAELLSWRATLLQADAGDADLPGALTAAVRLIDCMLAAPGWSDPPLNERQIGVVRAANDAQEALHQLHHLAQATSDPIIGSSLQMATRAIDDLMGVHRCPKCGRFTGDRPHVCRSRPPVPVRDAAQVKDDLAARRADAQHALLQLETQAVLQGEIATAARTRHAIQALNAVGVVEQPLSIEEVARRIEVHRYREDKHRRMQDFVLRHTERTDTYRIGDRDYRLDGATHWVTCACGKKSLFNLHKSYAQCSQCKGYFRGDPINSTGTVVYLPSGMSPWQYDKEILPPLELVPDVLVRCGNGAWLRINAYTGQVKAGQPGNYASSHRYVSFSATSDGGWRSVPLVEVLQQAEHGQIRMGFRGYQAELDIVSAEILPISVGQRAPEPPPVLPDDPPCDMDMSDPVIVAESLTQWQDDLRQLQHVHIDTPLAPVLVVLGSYLHAATPKVIEQIRQVIAAQASNLDKPVTGIPSDRIRLAFGVTGLRAFASAVGNYAVADRCSRLEARLWALYSYIEHVESATRPPHAQEQLNNPAATQDLREVVRQRVMDAAGLVDVVDHRMRASGEGSYARITTNNGIATLRTYSIHGDPKDNEYSFPDHPAMYAACNAIAQAAIRCWRVHMQPGNVARALHEAGSAIEDFIIDLPANLEWRDR